MTTTKGPSLVEKLYRRAFNLEASADQYDLAKAAELREAASYITELEGRAEYDARELELLADHANKLSDRYRFLFAVMAACAAAPRLSQKHDYWRAGEPDCPPELKAGNGELHTLRCRRCGLDSPRDQICRAPSNLTAEGRITELEGRCAKAELDAKEWFGEWQAASSLRLAESQRAEAAEANSARLEEALLVLLPANLGALPKHLADDRILPVDVTVGEIRQARAALEQTKGESGREDMASRSQPCGVRPSDVTDPQSQHSDGAQQ